MDGVIYKFRERYSVKGLLELSLYPGIKETLAALYEAGKTLFLATSKEEEYARQILDNTGLASFFTYIGGADLKSGRLSKAAVLRYVCETNGITDMSECVMVGDREHDVEGAHELGMPCIGVAYGYGGRGELEQTGADIIVPTVDDLQQVLLAN